MLRRERRCAGNLLAVAVGVACIIGAQCSGKTQTVKARFSPRHSLLAPYFDQNGHSETWSMKGDCSVVTHGPGSGIYLTTSRNSKAGGIVGRQPIKLSEWMADVHFEIKKDSAEQGEGLGFWITKAPFELGSGILAGDPKFYGVLVFIGLNKKTYTGVATTPYLGVATSYGQEAPSLKKAIPLEMEQIKGRNILRVRYFGGALRVYLGRDNRSLRELAALTDVFVDPSYHISVTSSNYHGMSQFWVTGINTAALAAPSRVSASQQGTKKASRAKTFLTWACFLLLLGFIVYFLYTQAHYSRKPQKPLRH